MIDVVFLLLVYFLLAADFSAREEIYRLDLPDQGGTAAAADPFRVDQDPLRIRIASAGDGPDAFRITLEPAYAVIDSAAALSRFLQQSLAHRDGGLFPSDHPILIEPTDRTAWEHSVMTFDAAVRAGYTNVIFLRLP